MLLVLSSDSAAAKPDAPGELPAIVVRVDNVAGVLPGHLQFAEDRASEVFARIGAAIRWTDQEESISEHISPSFTVVLVNAQGREGKEIGRASCRERVEMRVVVGGSRRK